MEMKRIVGFGIVLATIIATTMVVSALTDPYPLDGYVLYPNGTKVGVGANITFTNQNTTEVIYDDTSASSWYSADAGNFPSGYQDGHTIQYYSIYGEYTNTTYHIINITQGSNTMNITLNPISGDVAAVAVTDGSISFGNLKLNDAVNTEGTDTQIINTNGASGNQLIEIKLNESTVIGETNSTELTFVTGTPALNQLLCQFKGGDAVSYTALTTTYQNFDDVMLADTTRNLNIQLTMPSSVGSDSYYDNYQFEIIVKATLL